MGTPTAARALLPEPKTLSPEGTTERGQSAAGRHPGPRDFAGVLPMLTCSCTARDEGAALPGQGAVSAAPTEAEVEDCHPKRE